MRWGTFLRKLRKTDWVFGPDKDIVQKLERSNCPYLYATWPGPRVPITRLTGRSIPVEDIFIAADNAPGHNPRIRRALLKACRLS